MSVLSSAISPFSPKRLGLCFCSPLTTDTGNSSLLPFPAIENLGKAAAHPTRIDGRYSERNPGRAGWPHQISDHNAQDQT